jgi:hypothetical protein
MAVYTDYREWKEESGQVPTKLGSCGCKLERRDRGQQSRQSQTGLHLILGWRHTAGSRLPHIGGSCASVRKVTGMVDM